MAIHGQKSYVTLAAESTWGTSPGSPSYYHVPVLSMGIDMQRDRRNSQTFVGLRQRPHGRSFRGMPAGSIQTFLYGWKPGGAATSIMAYLIDWAFADHETVDLPSKLLEYAEGPDVANQRYNGLRVNGATIEGSADSGTITISLDLMGKTNSTFATAQTLPADREKCVDPDFQDCTFAIGGSAVLLRSFRLQIANNVVPTYLNGTAPAFLSAGQRTLSASFTFMKADDTYNAHQRAFSEVEQTGQIVIKGLHNGTGASGTYATCTLDLNRMALINPADSRGFSLTETTLNYDCLKPDSASNDVTITHGLA